MIKQLKNNIRREAKKLNVDKVKCAIDNMLPRFQNLLCRKVKELDLIFVMFC